MKNKPFWENDYKNKNHEYAFGDPSPEIIKLNPKIITTRRSKRRSY